VVVRTRIDVAKEVAPKFGVTLQDADRFVLLVLDEIKAMLNRGDEVMFKGFGRFSPVMNVALTISVSSAAPEKYASTLEKKLKCVSIKTFTQK
jgi:hypothetical protein